MPHYRYLQLSCPKEESLLHPKHLFLEARMQCSQKAEGLWQRMLVDYFSDVENEMTRRHTRRLRILDEQIQDLSRVVFQQFFRSSDKLLFLSKA